MDVRETSVVRRALYPRPPSLPCPHHRGAAATAARAKRSARSAHARRRRWRDQEQRRARGSAALSRSPCRLLLSWRGDARSNSKLGTQWGVGARRAAATARGARSAHARRSRRRDQERRLARGSAARSWSSVRCLLSWRGDASGDARSSSSKLGMQRGAAARGAAATAARTKCGARSAHTRRSRRRDQEQRLARGSAALSRSPCRLLLRAGAVAQGASASRARSGASAHAARRLRQYAYGALPTGFGEV